jgi:hypothetical protein
MQITQFKSQPRFPILAPDGTAAAPSYSFSGDTNCGFYYVGFDVVGLAANGAVGLRFGQGVIDIPIDAGLLRFGASVDTVLTRDAGDTLALRRGGNAQTLRGYFSYTDASNYARWALKTASGAVELAAETAGSGADDIDVVLTPAGTGNVRFGTYGAEVALVAGYVTIKDAGGTTRKLAVIA